MSHCGGDSPFLDWGAQGPGTGRPGAAALFTANIPLSLLRGNVRGNFPANLPRLADEYKKAELN